LNAFCSRHSFVCFLFQLQVVCAVCADGFFLTNSGCAECATTSPAAYIVILVVVLIVGVVLLLVACKKRKKIRAKVADGARKVRTEADKQGHLIKVSLAILLGFLQILSVVNVVSHSAVGCP
jgi:undecaprenyl pyrophosphate phosphatase UppP